MAHSVEVRVPFLDHRLALQTGHSGSCEIGAVAINRTNYSRFRCDVRCALAVNVMAPERRSLPTERRDSTVQAIRLESRLTASILDISTDSRRIGKKCS
jgi:hypothetical protein